jgi:hypothetical protein
VRSIRAAVVRETGGPFRVESIGAVRGLQVSRGNVLQHLLLKRQIGDKTLEANVLPFRPASGGLRATRRAITRPRPDKRAASREPEVEAEEV